MEKQIILTADTNPWKKASTLIRKAAGRLNAPVQIMGRYYAHVLEREISLRQAKALTEAQLAFFATVMPADFSVMLRAAACAWFVMSIRKCRSLL